MSASRRKLLATVAASATIALGVAMPSAHAAASATISFDFPTQVVVGDTVVAHLKVTNTGDKELGLTAIRAVLACETKPTATLCTRNEQRQVFEVRKAETFNSDCKDTAFRATQTGNRLLLEPVTNLGGPTTAAPLQPGQNCTVDLTLAVRTVPAYDADADPGLQTKAGAIAVLRNAATTPPTVLAPDDLNEIVTVDQAAPGDQPAPEPPASNVEGQPAVTCQGIKATIVGTAAGDTIKGTPGRDVIAGLGGGDIIDGGGGNDVICGGPGQDTIRGGAGNDRLSGGGDADVIYGEDGNDQIQGDGGNDRLNGGRGADQLSGGAGDDKLVGGPGNDRLVGGAGNDRGDGGPGKDTFASVEHRKN